LATYLNKSLLNGIDRNNVINYGYSDHSHERLIFSTRPAVWLALFCLFRGVGVSAQTPTLIGCLVFKEHAVFRSAEKRNYDASFSACQLGIRFGWKSVTTLLLFLLNLTISL
jgi:hypothetical protein